MNPSQSVNLQLSIEQVNHEAENSVSSYWLNRSSPQPPLDNVVDPNTEFKRPEPTSTVSPEISFGLKDVIKELQSKDIIKSKGVTQLESSHPLLQQLQQAYTAVVATYSTPKDTVLAPVHLQSPNKSSKSNQINSKGSSKISSPAQVANILKEKEPELVSEFLTLLNSEEKPTPTEKANTMDNYRDLSEFTIEIPQSSVAQSTTTNGINDDNQHIVNIESSTENKNMAPTSPVQLGSKTLHKFPPGYVTIMTEKGAPHTPEPQNINHYRKSSQSSQSSASNYFIPSTSKPTSVTEYLNASSNVVEPWNAENTIAPRYGSISNISDISLYNPESKNIPTSPVPYRNAEQMAWAMRHARDRYETASNFSACSSNLDSVCSERLDTMSMISDVSGYEEEMFRIKKLLLDPSTGKHGKYSKKTSYVPPQQNKIAPPEIPGPPFVTAINTEIAATHGQGKTTVKCDHDMITIEKTYESRIQDLLRNLAHTEGKLEACRNEFEKYIHERSHLIDKIAELESRNLQSDKADKLEIELNTAHQSVSQLESRIQELQVQTQQMEREKQHWQEEKQTCEAEISRLRLNGEELRLEMENKSASVQGLKVKVAEQHAELQGALQSRLQAEAATAQARAENEALRASQLWYKEQLSKAQEARSAAQQLASAASAQMALKDAQHEGLRSQIATLNQQLTEAGHQVVREKRSMLQQLETFEADMVAREAELAHRKSGGEIIEIRNQSEAFKISQLEGACSDLQAQLENVRAQLKAGEETTNQLSSEHASLLGRTTSLRQQLAERDLQLQQASDQLTALDANNCRLRREVSDKDKAIVESRSQIIKLQVSLDAASREKTEVDKAIEGLNNEFSQISTRYQKMKNDVRNKELNISNLETNLQKITTERDQLKEELVASKLKIDGYSEFTQRQVETLQNEIEKYKSELASLQEINENLLKEKDNVKNRLSESELQVETQLQQNQELAGRIAELTAGKNKAERKAAKLQESVTFREEQLLTAQQGMEKAHNSARESGDKVSVLEQQLQQYKSQLITLRDENQRSDAVVQQYAALCRNQEERKASYVSDATQTTFVVTKSDKTTMSDLVSNSNLVNNSNIESINVSVQHQPLMQDQCINTDALNLPIKNTHTASQTDLAADEEMKELHLTISILEEKLLNVQKQDETELKLKAEISKLQGLLDKGDAQAKDLRRKYQANISTLLRTIKDHMRGRKHAEQEVVLLQEKLKHTEAQNVEALNAKIADLHEQLKTSTERLNALKIAEKEHEEALILLERERGRLEGASIVMSQQKFIDADTELARMKRQMETAEKEREAVETRSSAQLKEVQQAAFASAKMVQDLHKQILNERRDTSSLRQQVSSLRMGLDTANQLLDSRATEISSIQSQLDTQRGTIISLESELSTTQAQLMEAKAREKALSHELQLNKDKDPLLADQLKRLSEVAQQRGSEAQACRQALEQAEQRWTEEAQTLNASLATAQEEASSLRNQLDEARKMRFSLQTLAAELRGALHASLEQGKILRARLTSLESVPSRSTLPDLTSSLPVPAALDESALAELLERSSAPPPPLTHLQSCLQSLQQEVNTLQQHLEQRTKASSPS